MSITAFSGPVVSFGTTPTSTAGTGLYGTDQEHNDQRAPSVSDLGDALLDPRAAYCYQPGAGVTAKTFGFFNNTGSVDFVPATVNSSAFNASSIASTGVTTFSIPSSIGVSSNGIISTTIIAPETGKVSGTLLAIDSTAAYVTFGSAGSIAAWNPGAGTGRNITFAFSSNTDGGSVTIAGRDMYGFKMTETLAVGSTVVSGKKAFKYVSSITNCTTPVSTGVSIGFGDVYGFPFCVPYAGINAVVNVNSSASISATVPLSTTNFVAALASSLTAATSSVDVRGTFTSTTASNGVARIQMTVTPAASAIAAITSTNVAPLFGVTQYSSV